MTRKPKNETKQAITTIATPDPALAEHAAVIRALGKRVVGDVIEIGRRLTDAKLNHCTHGQWLPWLEREFQWSESAALKFMQVHALSLKSVNFTDLEIPVSGLYLLAAPSTPDEVREAVIDRAEAGQKITVDDIKAEVASAKPSKSKSTKEPRRSPEDSQADIRAAHARGEITNIGTDEAAVLKAPDDPVALAASGELVWIDCGNVNILIRDRDAHDYKAVTPTGTYQVNAQAEMSGTFGGYSVTHVNGKDRRDIKSSVASAEAAKAAALLNYRTSVAAPANTKREPAPVPESLPPIVASPNYTNLIDAWHACSPDERRKFMRHIGATFVGAYREPADAADQPATGANEATKN